MSRFTEAFLLLFVQISVGGLLSLSITPFHDLGQSFYRSTGAVFFSFAALSVLARFAIFDNPLGQMSLMSTAALLVFVISFGFYLFALWRDDQALIARSYAISFFSGILTLLSSGFDFQTPYFLGLERLLYSFSLVLSALAIGSAIATMLLGHWYLIDPNISIEPFRRLFRFFLFVLLAQVFWEAAALGTLQLFGSDSARGQVAALFSDRLGLFLIRVVLAQLGALLLCFFIWKTLQIPHTMAATGLLYIAVLFVSVGEILAKWLLTLTSLPL